MERKQKSAQLRVGEVVYQDEVSDCGFACVAMIAQSMGKTTTVDEIRRRFPLGAEGVSMADIVEILTEIGIRSIPVKFDPSAIDELPVPAIVHYGGNHFVVLADKKRRHVRIHNPASGSLVFHAKEILGNITGFAVVLEGDQGPAGEEAQSGAARPQRAASVGKLPRAKTLLLGALAVGGISFVMPVIAGIVVDQLGSLSASRIWAMLGVALLALAAATLLEVFIAHTLLRSTASIVRRQVHELFLGLLRKEPGFFERRTPADIHSRVKSLESALIELPGLSIQQKVAAGTALFAIIGMFVIDSGLALLSCTVMVAFALVSSFLGATRTNMSLKSEEAIAARGALMLESIRGISAIRSGAMLTERSEKFASRHHNALTAGLALQRLDVHQGAIYKAIAGTEQVLMLGIAFHQLSAGGLTLGMLFAYLFFRNIALSAGGSFFLGRARIRQHAVAERRATEIVRYPEREEAKSDGEFVELQLSDVRYSIGKSRTLLTVDHMRVRQGEKVAIVGRSGSGKTTLLKLLAGDIVPGVGRIRVTKDPAESLNSNLAGISYLHGQNEALFLGSIADNITLFGRNGTRRSADSLVEQLGLLGAIERLPAGMLTNVSEEAPVLLLGERQRLLIARALCSPRPVLLLDEPVANLDACSAALVMDVLMRSDKAIVVALHDYKGKWIFDQTIKVADGVVVTASRERPGDQSLLKSLTTL